MEGRLDVETSNRPCGRISRSLAFAAMRKGEARMRRSKGPKPLRRTPLSDSPARRETPTVLNLSNRRIQTRMYGGVGGEESRGSPPIPIPSNLPASTLRPTRETARARLPQPMPAPAETYPSAPGAGVRNSATRGLLAEDFQAGSRCRQLPRSCRRDGPGAAAPQAARWL